MANDATPAMLQIVLAKDANHSIPEAMIDRAISECGDVIGIAVVDKGAVDAKIAFAFVIVDFKDLIVQTQAQMKDKRVFFYLTRAPEEVADEAFQPFNVITGKDNKVLLSVMLDGEFPEDVTDDGMPSTYNFMRDALAPKLQKVYAECGKDLKKTLQVFAGDAFRKEIEAMCAPRGSIFLIPSEGLPIAYMDNNLGYFFKPWGYVSNTLGYTEKVVAEAETQPIDTSKMSKRQLAALKQQEAAPQQVPDKPVTGQPAALPPSGTPVADPAPNLFYNKDQGNALWWRPTKGSNRDQAKGQWITHSSLSVPKDVADLFKGFPVAALKKESPLRAIAENPTSAIADQLKAKGGAVASAAVDDKNPIDQTLQIGAKEKQTFVDNRKAGNFKPVSVAEIMAKAKDHPPASAQLGISLWELLSYPTPQLFRLDKRSLVLAFHEARMKLNEVKPALFEKPADQPAVQVPDSRPAADPQAQPGATPAAEPEKIDETKLSRRQLAALRAKAA